MVFCRIAPDNELAADTPREAVSGELAESAELAHSAELTGSAEHAASGEHTASAEAAGSAEVCNTDATPGGAPADAGAEQEDLPDVPASDDEADGQKEGPAPGIWHAGIYLALDDVCKLRESAPGRALLQRMQAGLPRHQHQSVTLEFSGSLDAVVDAGALCFHFASCKCLHAAALAVGTIECVRRTSALMHFG